jgi:hypothetical protein
MSYDTHAFEYHEAAKFFLTEHDDESVRVCCLLSAHTTHISTRSLPHNMQDLIIPMLRQSERADGRVVSEQGEGKEKKPMRNISRPSIT